MTTFKKGDRVVFVDCDNTQVRDGNSSFLNFAWARDKLSINNTYQILDIKSFGINLSILVANSDANRWVNSKQFILGSDYLKLNNNKYMEKLYIKFDNQFPLKEAIKIGEKLGYRDTVNYTTDTTGLLCLSDIGSQYISGINEAGVISAGYKEYIVPKTAEYKPLPIGKTIGQLGYKVGDLFIGVRPEYKDRIFQLTTDNNTTKPLFKNYSMEAIAPLGAQRGIRLSALSPYLPILDSRPKKDRDFKIGDTVKIVKEQTINYFNYSNYGVGDTFKIVDFNDSGTYARPMVGLSTGVGIGLLELVEEVKEVLELPKKSIIITPKTTKAELLAELKNKEIRIKTAIEIYGEQEKLKKDLTSKLTSIQLELDTSKKQYAELKGQLEEKEKEFLTLQAKPLIGEKSKPSKFGKSWDNIIISDSDYKKLVFAYDKNLPLLLRGSAGTGKSSFIRALAEEKGVSLVQFNFNQDTTVEHLLGHKVLTGDPLNPMEFEDGPLTRAVRNGGVFLGDELNTSDPGIQFILNGLLEHTKGHLGTLSVQGNNGEVIVPHQDFRFFGTYNPGYLGTKSFGTSLMSRFIGVEVLPLVPTKEIHLLSAKFPNVNLKLIEQLVELETQLRKEKNVGYDISTRDLVQVLEMLDYGFGIVDSVITSVGGALQLEIEQTFLRQYASKIWGEVDWS